MGLRTAQLGAVFAFRVHWTVSDSPATIVMPTGTGKTEILITKIVAEQRNRVFINSTDKSASNKFAESVFDDDQRLSGENIFKCLYGINHLMLANVGLNSAIDGSIRYDLYCSTRR